LRWGEGILQPFSPGVWILEGMCTVISGKGEKNMPDYVVTLESAWILRDVKSLDDAIGIAISEAGKRLNPAAKYVDVEAGFLTCPYCEETLSSAIVVADTALVGLVLEMKVFRAESPEHAERIAKSVVGKALKDVPLKLLDVQTL
jgi:hypothetical protein